MPTKKFSGDASSKFQIVILYDTAAAGCRAVELTQRVMREASQEMEFRRALWRFDVLGLPGAIRSADTCAAAADLVIIATSRESRLPANVKKWLARWRDSSTPDASALVALLVSSRPAGGGLSPVRRFLQETAAEAGQAFFAAERAPRVGSVGAFRAPVRPAFGTPETDGFRRTPNVTTLQP
jgi:hypothetical protein